MKQLFCLLLAVCMMASLCACGKGREKDAGNDTLSSDREVSAPTESIPVPEDQQSPEESEQLQSYAGKVDVDLTVLSSTMVYSEVYNMLYNDPAHYLGKTVKARGTFSIYQLVTDGVLQPDPVSYACIISDATACCAEGMEFVLKDDLAYPDDYPELGAEITVIGEFQSYEEKGQINMDLCCDFLALRLSLHTDKVKLFDFDKRKTETFNTHNTLFVNIYQSILAYYFALMGETDKIPDEFREHKLDGINYLAPCKPMMYLIENQVYLIQNEVAKVIGRSDSLIAQCRAVPYNLCEIHILIQTAEPVVPEKKKPSILPEYREMI